MTEIKVELNMIDFNSLLRLYEELISIRSLDEFQNYIMQEMYVDSKSQTII